MKSKINIDFCKENGITHKTIRKRDFSRKHYNRLNNYALQQEYEAKLNKSKVYTIIKLHDDGVFTEWKTSEKIYNSLPLEVLRGDEK